MCLKAYVCMPIVHFQRESDALAAVRVEELGDLRPAPPQRLPLVVDDGAREPPGRRRHGRAAPHARPGSSCGLQLDLVGRARARFLALRASFLELIAAGLSRACKCAVACAGLPAAKYFFR